MSRLRTMREWPFCQEDIAVTVVAPSIFQVKIEKQQLFRWLYRVKGWRAAISLSYVWDVSGSNTAVTLTATIDTTRTETSEAVFACSSPEFSKDGSSLGTGTWANAFFSGVVDVYSSLSIGRGFSNVEGYPGLSPNNHWVRDAADFATAKFVPSIVFNISAQAQGVGAPSLGFGFTTLKPPVAMPQVSGTIDSSALIIVARDNEVSSLTGTFTISPLSYWPYDPGDGLGPIWNATTGAQIRNPLTS